MLKKIALLFLALALSSTSLFAKKEILTAENGILDLRNCAITEAIRLDGQWAFYWKEFIDPSHPERSNVTIFPEIPSYWIQYKEVIPDASGFGYGTYRLQIFFSENYIDTLSLKIPVFDTSFKLYLNGEYIGGNGNPASSIEKSRPEYKPFTHDFILDTNTIDIVVHVSNFHHRKGGFWKPMYLGQKEEIANNSERSKIFTFAFMGVLGGAFLLFFVFFLLDNNKKSFLYFSLATLGMLFRLLNSGLFAGPSIINISWEWVVRLEYLGTYVLGIFCILYLNRIFPLKRMKIYLTLYTSILSLLILLVLFFKVHIYSWSIYIVEALGIILLLFYTFHSFHLMLKKQKKGTFFFISIAIILFALLNDIFIANSLHTISSEYMLPIAFFILIATNAYLLISDWILALREKEVMHTELLQINKNLENIIQHRTEDLKNSNEELSASLDFKSHMFAIIAHDLKSPIATLSQYADLIYKNNIAKDDRGLYTNLRQLAHSAVDLINNLLSWGMKQGQEMQYKPESCRLKKECENIYSIFSYQFEEKNVSLDISIPDNLEAYCDSALLKITLRNLLSNALKFTNKDGQVMLSARQKGEKVLFKIEDNGIGMSEEIVEEILTVNTSSTRGTDGEKGTGLGFIVVKDLVAMNNGTLSIESNPGRGTTISFTLPGKP